MYDKILVDLIQTRDYHAVYYDGDLAYWEAGQLSAWNSARFAQALHGASHLRVTEFRYNRHDRDVPEDEPFPHMDDWQERGLLETAEYQKTVEL